MSNWPGLLPKFDTWVRTPSVGSAELVEAAEELLLLEADDDDADELLLEDEELLDAPPPEDTEPPDPPPPQAASRTRPKPNPAIMMFFPIDMLNFPPLSKLLPGLARQGQSIFYGEKIMSF